MCHVVIIIKLRSCVVDILQVGTVGLVLSRVLAIGRGTMLNNPACIRRRLRFCSDVTSSLVMLL